MWGRTDASFSQASSGVQQCNCEQTTNRPFTDSEQLEGSILQIQVSHMSASHVQTHNRELGVQNQHNMKGVFRPCWAENQPKNINVESNQNLQLWLVSICFSATLNWCHVWRASSRCDSVTRPQLRTDPNKVGGSQRSAAGASGLAVDVHAVPLLSVLQGKLHASVQVLQAGNAGEVNGGQPQLLHACSPPLLPPHYKQMQSVDYTQLQHNSVLFLCHVCNSVAEPLHTRPAAAALLDSFTHNMLAWYRWRKLTSAELQKYLVSYISFMVITARTFSVSTSCDTRNSFSVQQAWTSQITTHVRREVKHFKTIPAEMWTSGSHLCLLTLLHVHFFRWGFGPWPLQTSKRVIIVPVMLLGPLASWEPVVLCCLSTFWSIIHSVHFYPACTNTL